MVGASDLGGYRPRERLEAQAGGSLGEAPTADAVGISREASTLGATGLRQWLDRLQYIVSQRRFASAGRFCESAFGNAKATYIPPDGAPRLPPPAAITTY